MAVSENDLMGLTLVAQRKPEKVRGVTVSQVPPALITLLEQEAPKALADKNYELVLALPVSATEPVNLSTKDRENEDKVKAHKEATEAYEAAKANAVANVKQLALYATGWGKVQTPKLYISKVPNRRDDKDAPIARLKVQLWDDVPQDNRPGRRS